MNGVERDRILVKRLLAGDEAAFDEFADHYIPALHRFAMVRLRGDLDLSRDIVQGTLCKAIAKLGTFRGEAALMTWLCACCRNEIAAHFRRRQRAGIEIDFEACEEVDAGAMTDLGPAGPEVDLLRKETASLVHLALDSLPPRYGKALEWKYIEALSVVEIAERLGLGPKAAESLLTRARVAFKEEHHRLLEALRTSSTSYSVAATRMEAHS
jgi:RNA polymerase sigma-70 factor (ECF subfamily)